MYYLLSYIVRFVMYDANMCSRQCKKFAFAVATFGHFQIIKMLVQQFFQRSYQYCIRKCFTSVADIYPKLRTFCVRDCLLYAFTPKPVVYVVTYYVLPVPPYSILEMVVGGHNTQPRWVQRAGKGDFPTLKGTVSQEFNFN